MHKQITEEMFVKDMLEHSEFSVEIIKFIFDYMNRKYNVKNYNAETIAKKFILIHREDLFSNHSFSKELQDYSFNTGCKYEKLETKELFELFSEIKLWPIIYKVDEFSYVLDKDYYKEINY